jgi:hypothetical protein
MTIFTRFLLALLGVAIGVALGLGVFLPDLGSPPAAPTTILEQR